MQAKLTKRPTHHSQPYHYKGPGTQCWHSIHQEKPTDYCDECVWMVQTCRVLAALPEEKLTQLETEAKIRARVRLSPLENITAPFPTNWQQLGAISFQLWTPGTRPPTLSHGGYVLYSNQDAQVQGSRTLTTGIGLKLPPNTTALLIALEEPTNYVVTNLITDAEFRVSVHVIAPFPTLISAKQAIARIVLVQTINPAPELVAAGQKVQEQPSPFLKTLNPDQDQQIEDLLKQYEDIFAVDLKSLGQTTIIRHRIDTEEGKVTFSKKYKQSWESEDFITAEVGRMLEANIIKQLEIDTDENTPCTPFASPVVVVGKKDGSKRFCVDYRKLNKITVTNSYPLPIIHDIFSNIAKRGLQPKYFSALDLASGYWQ
ncbi:8666_t:CDS:1, partial [Paraglomus occultum]